LINSVAKWEGDRPKKVFSATSRQYRKQIPYQSGCCDHVVSTLALFSGYFGLQISARKLAVFVVIFRGFPLFFQENAGILPHFSTSYQLICYSSSCHLKPRDISNINHHAIKKYNTIGTRLQGNRKPRE
jgi:hypothetical protein